MAGWTDDEVQVKRLFQDTILILLKGPRKTRKDLRLDNLIVDIKAVNISIHMYSGMYSCSSISNHLV